ncbi:MAG: cation transporter [Candidatus Peregrinibacteria bacterium]|nr:cation transporter [Candidatus Peregrinibacteria bacterium]
MNEHKHQTQENRQLEYKFIWTFILNGALAIGELVMSVVTGSTAVLADGLMNVDDLVALGFSIYSERQSRRTPDEQRTFGYVRMDALAGFVKGCLLLLSSLVVVLQAGKMLLMPEEVAGTTVLIIGIASFAVNFISSMMLKEDACCSLNAKGTYACMTYDMIGSGALIVSGLFSRSFTIAYIDVAAALLIAFFMLRSGWSIFREGARLFLQSAPMDFQLDAFEKAVMSVAGVTSVGDIHVWSLTPKEHHLSCRITIQVRDACECDRILQEVEEIAKRFNIQHTTIQPVYTGDNLKRFCS